MYVDLIRIANALWIRLAHRLPQPYWNGERAKSVRIGAHDVSNPAHPT